MCACMCDSIKNLSVIAFAYIAMNVWGFSLYAYSIKWQTLENLHLNFFASWFSRTIKLKTFSILRLPEDIPKNQKLARELKHIPDRHQKHILLQQRWMLRYQLHSNQDCNYICATKFDQYMEFVWLKHITGLQQTMHFRHHYSLTFFFRKLENFFIC